MATVCNHNCSVCSQEISTSNDKHIICDCCGKYYHPSCTGISNTAAKHLAGEGQQILWFCTDCRNTHPYKTLVEKAKKESSQMTKDHLKAINETLEGLNRRLSLVEQGPFQAISCPNKRGQLHASRHRAHGQFRIPQMSGLRFALRPDKPRQFASNVARPYYENAEPRRAIQFPPGVQLRGMFPGAGFGSPRAPLPAPYREMSHAQNLQGYNYQRFDFGE